MRILELSLRNYRVFEEVDLELPARVIGVFGENGAGKTTLMESIAFACFGVDAARTKKQEIRTQGVLTDCSVRVVFEHGGRQYEVRRTLRGRGSMPEAELFVGDLLLASGTSEVDAEIRRVLHMDLRVFRSSVFAEQKQLDALSSMRPGERKEMALRLLGIKPVDDARTNARRESRAARQSADQLTGAIPDIAELEAAVKEERDAADELEGEAAARTSAVEGAEEAHAAAKAAFEASDRARQEAEKLLVGIRSARSEHERETARYEQLCARVDALTAALEELPALERELAELAGAPERLRAAERLTETMTKTRQIEEEIARLAGIDVDGAIARAREASEGFRAAERQSAAAAAALEHERERLDLATERFERASEADPSEPCPTCGRPLGEDFAGYLKHCRSEVTAAKRAVSAATKAVSQVERSLAQASRQAHAAEVAGGAAREAAARRDELVRQLETLTSDAATLAEPFGGEVPDLDVLRRDLGRTSELAELVATRRADVPHLEAAQRDAAEATERVASLERMLADLVEQAEAIEYDDEDHRARAQALASAEASLVSARQHERAASQRLAEVRQRLARLDGELAQARETAARVDDLRSAARHVERVAMLLDGFRDHLVGRIGPELSREAEALFRELTDREYDDLRVDEETLSIEIADGDTYHPIERFSGSETDLANLALRVAISSHLSAVSRSDVGLMVLDEVLASLDEERKDLMVTTLGRLAVRFHQLFVITHAERVKDQFPAAIQVRKTGRRRSDAALL
jgi:DNA repair protein SbcC/Rad50